MKVILRTIRSKPAPKTSVDLHAGPQQKGAKSAKATVEPGAPRRVKDVPAPKKSRLERAIEAVTAQKSLDRKRRKEWSAELNASRARDTAIAAAMKRADVALEYLVKAININRSADIQSACTSFHEALEPFSRETPHREADTPDDVLDATQLRGTRILRLVQALSKPGPDGSHALKRLESLHDSMNKLPPDAAKDPLIAQLAFAVKAELLHHAIASISLDQVRQVNNAHLRAQGLDMLCDMGSAANDVNQWMQSSAFVMKGAGSTAKMRYGIKIPGSSLTRDKLVALIPQSEAAARLRMTDHVASLHLPSASLLELRHFKAEIVGFQKIPNQPPRDLLRYQTLHQALSAEILKRRPFADFKNSLRAAFGASDKLLPRELLAHVEKTGKVLATLEKDGIQLSREQSIQRITKSLKGVSNGDLQRLQLSLHYGDCKWLLHELAVCGTVRATAAREHLNLLKEVLDTRLPVPQPPAKPMIQNTGLASTVRLAFQAHPYPQDEDAISVPGSQKIKPHIEAALVSITHLNVSPQALAPLRGVQLGRLVQHLAQQPAQLDVLNMALDRVLLNDKGKTTDPLIARMSLAVKSGLLVQALARTASLDKVMQEDVTTRSEGLIALINLSDIAQKLLTLRLEVASVSASPDPATMGAAKAKTLGVDEEVFPDIPLSMKALQNTVNDGHAAHRQRVADTLAQVQSIQSTDMAQIPTPDLLQMKSELGWLLETSDGIPNLHRPVLNRINAVLRRRVLTQKD